MGQTVEIRDVVQLGDTLLVDTDRSFTGQDGQEITIDSPGHAVPGRLGAALFELGVGVDYLFVLQNTVSVRRPGGWDEATVSAVSSTISGFLRHYDEEE